MKKIIALFAVLAIGTAKAQVTVKPGFRAGLNLSRLTQTDFDYKTDFYAGGLVAIKLSRFYTLQPEITYTRQGAKGDITVFNDAAQVYEVKKQNLNIDYLSVGLINKFTFNDKFDVHLGPTMDFQTDSNSYTNTDVDLDFQAGIGYTLPFGLTFEARVKKGLIDVLETDDYKSYQDGFYVDNYNTNLVFQFGISYTFRITGTTK